MRHIAALSTALLMTISSGFGLAHEAGKEAGSQLASTDPHLLWKFETGG
jgi:hypothetical protein